jgi:hypothetical protein
MRSLQIFISSQEQDLEPQREISETVIESMEMTPIRFEHTLVPQAVQPREAYLKAVDSSDLFVLLLWQKNSAAVIEEYNRAQRRGKPVLCLIKTINTNYSESRSKELEDFIARVKDDGYSSSNFRTLRELQTQLRRGIGLTLGRERSGQFHASSKEDLFTAGTELIERARRRVILMAKTPLTLVGTRPYDGSTEPDAWEKHQLAALDLLMKATSNGGAIPFRCIATVPSMRADLVAGGAGFRERVKQRLSNFYLRTAEPGSGCELRWVVGDPPSAISYLVVDDSFLIWLSDGTGESVWMQAKNARMATALDSISVRISRLLPDLGEIHRALEL